MILDVCIKCGCTTEVDAFSLVCDGCLDCIGETVGGKEMNFIEAIGKYEAITRDGGTTVYSKNSEGNIMRKTNGIGGGFQLNYELLLSRGWKEYQEHELIVPKRVDYSHRYVHIGGDDSKVYTDSDCRFEEDADRLKSFNYFTDKEFAQYVANRQLLDRIEVVLYNYNKDKMDSDTLVKLINDYINTYYREVVNQVSEYQDKM